MCAIHFQSGNLSILFINLLMPYEDGDSKSEEFVIILSISVDLIEQHSDCQAIIVSDLNVDFNRNRISHKQS